MRVSEKLENSNVVTERASHDTPISDGSGCGGPKLAGSSLCARFDQASDSSREFAVESELSWVGQRAADGGRTASVAAALGNELKLRSGTRGHFGSRRIHRQCANGRWENRVYRWDVS